MLEQLEIVLHEHPMARRNDPATSHDAAASVRNITETHNRLLRLLRNEGPLTDEEMLDVWVFNGFPRISPSGLRSRRAELVDAGYVVDSGERGQTASGRSCTIWRAAE